KEGITTDANGEVQVADLPFGNYDLIETKAPAGYELSKEVTQITIDKDNTAVSKVITNAKVFEKQITLLKKDGATKELLDGASFVIQRDNLPWEPDEPLETVVDEEAVNGQLSFKVTKPGVYTFVETRTPNGYLKLEKPVAIYVYADGYMSKASIDNSQLVNKTDGSYIEIYNNKFINVDVHKISSTDKKVLPGATFNIKKLCTAPIYSGSSSFGEITTKEFVEISTSCPTPPPVYGPKSLPLENDIELRQPSVPLPPPSPMVNISSELDLGNYTTDETGTFSYAFPGPGMYKVTEVSAPEGYKLNETPQFVRILDDNTVQVFNTQPCVPPPTAPPVILQPKSASSDFVETRAITTCTQDAIASGVNALTFENDPLAGTLNIKKVDSQDESKVLEGAEFKLVQGDKVIKEGIVTDANGAIQVADLPYGDYELVETKAPVGYELSKEIVKVTIHKDHVTVDQVVKNEKTPDPTGTLNIKKVDSQDESKVLEGAEFKLVQGGKVIKEGILTDANGTIQVADLPYGDYELVETKAPVGYELSKEVVKVTIDKDHVTVDQVVKNEKTPDPTGTLNIKKIDSQDETKVLEGAEFKLVQGDKVIKEGIVTDANGTIQVADLPYGDYELVETKAPVGYELSKEAVKVTIDKNHVTVDQVVKNEKTPDPTGTLNIKKVDSQDESKVLEGAEFKLVQGDKVIKENLVTDKDGKIEIKDLPYGDYELEETKAPEGYELSKE
ncbi:SpaA isopeptide-forming pilin-related protein, partial [Macrococcus capreoli]|uniref:SpaA isopeptide-forming pilin-related protein n=1 Tax=Macrococcus capreoli TaxID=2982690 RepID=UPI003F43F866